MQIAIIFAFCLSSVWGMKELDPINDEEKHDEVAQAQERAVWIACMFLAYNKLETIEEPISELAAREKLEVKDIRKKIAADILEGCNSEISYTEAEEILSSQTLDLNSALFSKFLSISLDTYTKNLSLTPSQSELLSLIEKETNTKDEDLVPEPPKIPSAPLNPESFPESYYYALFLILCLLLITIYLVKKKKPSPVISKTNRKKKQ
jgi:hypothetical protein